MNIAYDLFLDHPEAIQIVQKDTDLNTFFTEIIKFVEERLNPLNDELEKAEDKAEENGEWNGTIICVMRNDGKFINFHGYPEPLRNKMLSCFTKEDIDFILKKVEAIRNARNN